MRRHAKEKPPKRDEGSATRSSRAACVTRGQKVKGASQMAAGAVLAAAGVPLCVLPGPGVAAIAGGAALASRGQRVYTGRPPSPVERRLDAAAEKMGAVAKEQAGRAARAAAREVPKVAAAAARAAGRGAVAVAKGAVALAAKGARAVRDRARP
ncbi:hypothetical protein [Collinsella tanakaei]|uniref:hypothetical protein n=1 Tax=Collinsella tanakaei TaxID=626935 RepID=UPI00195CF676|nr:hypothetical protein [Collinsella tanakaei]MBM6866973.1 hypothetical protein [Collinsella tanakaei]